MRGTAEISHTGDGGQTQKSILVSWKFLTKRWREWRPGANISERTPVIQAVFHGVHGAACLTPELGKRAGSRVLLLRTTAPFCKNSGDF